MPTLVLFVASLALALWCLVDLLPREESELQTLPKAAWVLVLLVPLVGAVAYLLGGRSPQARPAARGTRTPGRRAPQQPAVRGPEDDPEFQAQLRRRVEEQRRRARGQRGTEQPEG